MDPLIDIQQLDFAYAQQLVLKQISLRVDRGTILGLIGPNGGGKTSLLRLLLGLESPTRGTIQIDGLSPRQAVSRGTIVGYLPQNPRVPENFPLSVRQLVRLGLAGKTGLLRLYDKSDLAFVDDLIDRIGLSEIREQPIGRLSGGQLQRVLIARALAARPKLLLLDEPTTGIDSAGQQRFVEFLLNLKRELNLTLVLVSHDLRTVTRIADRIACLNLTLHYHDVPHQVPAEVAQSLFGCDLAAMGIGEHLDHGHAHSPVQLTISGARR